MKITNKLEFKELKSGLKRKKRPAIAFHLKPWHQNRMPQNTFLYSLHILLFPRRFRHSLKEHFVDRIRLE